MDYLEHAYKMKLSLNQVYVTYLIFKKDYASLYKYINEATPLFDIEIEDLIQKGLVYNYTEGNDFSSDSIELTPKCKNYWRKALTSLDLGQELWDSYPNMIYLESAKKFVSAKSCDKEKILLAYQDKINNNEKRHMKVLQLLNEAKKLNLISMGIEKFILSEQWTALDELVQGEARSSYGQKEL
jgi:DNA-binding MarR family transcriptional regulator